MENKLKKKNRRIIEGIIISIFSLLIILLLLELVIRIGRNIHLLPKVPNITEEIYSEPYKNAPFDIATFLAETAGIYSHVYNESADIWMPKFELKNMDGKLVSFDGEFRKTLFQPEIYENTIYIFGGSTVYSTNTPDEWTIPSQIQFLLAKDSLPYRVINTGMPGYKIEHQNIILSQLTLQDGDIVVYYDGSNNIDIKTSFSPHRMNDINRMKQDDNKFMIFVGKIQKYTIRFLDWLAKHSVFFHYLQTYRWDLLFSPIRTPEYQQQLIDQSAQVFKNDILEAIKLVSSTGKDVKFIHILQPTIFTTDNLDEHDTLIRASYGKDLIFLDTYNRFSQISDDLNQENVFSFNLPNVLEGQNSIFFDYCHVNHQANIVIAHEIYQLLTDVIQ